MASSKRRDALLWVAAALGGLLASGCINDRDRHPPTPVEPNSLKADRTLAPAQTNAQAWPKDDWWRTYGDPQLNTLMDEALAGSPSLQVAQARLRAAQAEVTRASGALLPSTALDGEVTRQRYSGNGLYPAPFAGHYYTDARVALDFSYDLDFWGHNRDILESTRANVHAAEADRDAARLALTVAAARAYFNLNLQFANLQVAKDSLVQQNSILDLTQRRAARGLENIARVRESEANVALTRAGVSYVEASIQLVRSQLGALVGAGPDRGLDLRQPVVAVPDKVELPSVLPADLLGRRLDVTAERWRVEAATHGIAAAEAAFYPNVNLTAFAGFQTIGWAKLFNGQSAIAGAGPALSLPLFNRRQLRGELQAQQAQYDLSVAQYNQTVIDAVNDVANVVTNWGSLLKEADDARVAEDAASKAYSITKDRYRAGLDNYLTVLSSENEVFLTQAVRAQLLARQLNLTVDLVRALGGGYSAAMPAGN
jgi:NodT family efflux transporter outer membrane factor (OMF) lipoprotein